MPDYRSQANILAAQKAAENDRQNSELFRALVSQGNDRAMQQVSGQQKLEQMGQSHQQELSQLQAQESMKNRLAEEELARDEEGIARLREGGLGNRSVKVGNIAVSEPNPNSTKGGPNQLRLEGTALNNIYREQTKEPKKQLDILESASKLVKDPSNIDDQQLRRQMAMAVNSGALSDKDVDDALPGDIELMARRGYNFIQPALSFLGAKKVPVYSEGTRRGIEKLIGGKMKTAQDQAESAGRQVEAMAPVIAPNLTAQGPEALKRFIGGVQLPRSEQITRAQAPQEGAALSPRQELEMRRKASKGK